MRDFRDIISWDEKAPGDLSLSLNTGMTERDFARAGFARLLDNPGLLAVPAGGTAPPEPARFIVSCKGFSFYEWRFTNTELTDTRQLRLSVPIPSGADSRGKLLYDCVTDEDLDARLRWAGLLTVISAMEAAVSAGMAGMTASCGPLGIIAVDNGSVLFLPEPLFPRLIASFGDDFAHTYFDIWLPPEGALSRGAESGAVYTASACLYRMLAGFSPQDEKANGYTGIVPLEIAAYNIDGAIAALIDRGLGLRRKEPSIRDTRSGGKGGSLPSLSEIRSALPDSRDGCFTGPETEESGRKRLDEFTRKLRKKTAFRSFLRKKRTPITIAGAAAAIIAVLTLTLVIDLHDRPTTTGLEPQEVVEHFYQAITELDVGNADVYVTEGAGESYITSMSSVYVISKMREAYERRRFIVTPAQWFAMDMPKELSAFGIIGLIITEIPPPSEEEYACLASFYFFYPPDAEDTDADLLPVITLHEDTVFLSRKKAGWRIYSLIQNDESELSAAQTSQLIGELYLIYREEE